MKLSILFIGWAAISAVAFGQGPRTFVIHRVVKQGGTITFKIVGRFLVQGMTVGFAASARDRVAAVNADGSYVLKRTQMPSTVSLYGSKIHQPAQPSETLTMNSDGSLKSLKGNGATGDDYRIEHLQDFVEPGKPVAVGDSWSKDYAPESNGSVTAHVVFKVLGEETLGGVKTLEIQERSQEISGPQPGSQMSTLWLDESNWALIKMSSIVVDVPEGGRSTPMSGTLTLTKIGS